MPYLQSRTNHGKITANLNKTDILILQQLDKNCRISFRGIGRKIRRSKEFVRYRFHKLIENDVINSFITSIDYARLGMYRVCIYTKFKEMTDELRKRIIKYKEGKDCRVKFFSVGLFDLYIDWVLGKSQNPDILAYEFMLQFGDCIQESSLNVLYKIKHYRNRYLYGKEVCPPFISEYTQNVCVNIPEDEKKILYILRDDPRIPIVDISSRCGLSTRTVMTKIANLKKSGIITGFCIKLNNPNVDKEDYIILLKLNDKSEKARSKIEAYLDSTNEVSYMGKLIGEFDLEFAITVGSQEEFIQILDKMRSNLKKEIQKLDVLFLSPDKKIIL